MLEPIKTYDHSFQPDDGHPTYDKLEASYVDGLERLNRMFGTHITLHLDMSGYCAPIMVWDTEHESEEPLLKAITDRLSDDDYHWDTMIHIFGSPWERIYVAFNDVSPYNDLTVANWDEGYDSLRKLIDEDCAVLGWDRYTDEEFNSQFNH